MKRILLISFEYPTGRTYCGGVGQIVKLCRKALLSMGYEVYVLLSSELQKRYPVKLLLPDGSVLRFCNFWAFRREYDWHGFNYVIQHFVNLTNELEKLKTGKKNRPKIIYHFHSILRREKDSGFKTLDHFLFNQEKMIDIADNIICPSRYEYENFMRYFPNFGRKVNIIENTIEAFPPRKERMQKVKSQHGINESDIISIYVGRLEKIKGAEIIIQNVPYVLSRHRNVKIFIIGKTIERSLYRQLVRIQKRFPNQVYYMRYLEKEILFQYFYLSHIYINTSLSESFSLTTHESALCDNALLLNSLPVFGKFKNAALFFSHSHTNGNGFISRYEALIRNRELRNELSSRASRIARDFLSKNRLKESFSDFFRMA